MNSDTLFAIAREQKQKAVFDALWKIAQEHRLEAVTPSLTRYAVTGDIIRQMAAAAVQAMRPSDENSVR